MYLTQQEYLKVVRITELEFNRLKKYGCQVSSFDGDNWVDEFESVDKEYFESSGCGHLLLLHHDIIRNLPQMITFKEKKCRLSKTQLELTFDRDGDFILHLEPLENT